MAKATRAFKLERRSQREGLERRRYYSANVSKGVALVYRRHAKLPGGSWYVRIRDAERNTYVYRELGAADDHRDANGVDVLDYFQAQDKARQFADAHVAESVRDEAAERAELRRNMTVGEVAARYLDWYKLHRKAYRNTEIAIQAHVLPAFRDTPVTRLTTEEINDWRDGLANKPPRRRTKRSGKPAYGMADDSPEAKRRRKASVNRILTVFKAMLNRAKELGWIDADPVWREVKPFEKVDTPRVRFLSDAEVQRLINACPSDFRVLVQAAMHTGARYGELAHAVASDFDEAAGTLYLRVTKNGKPRHAYLTPSGQRFLKSVAAGKAAGDLLFPRDDGHQWGRSHQTRPMRDACAAARIEPAVSFHILRHTYGAALARAGVPLQVIAAALGHSDTRITERHYAHLMPSYVADQVRSNLPDFGGEHQNKVVAIG